MAQIAIIGLGSVGSSIGLALHRHMQSPDGKGTPFTIVGYDPDPDTQQRAPKLGSVDRTAGDPAAAVRESAFVILALPTGQIHEMLRLIAPQLPEGATVTDTAAGKRQVLAWAAALLPPGVSFVGGHPLPRRVLAPAINPDAVVDEPADADLFRGAPYCIMPLASATEAAVNQVISLAETLGAQPFFTDPQEHDSFHAAIHDLPVLTSFALMHVLGSSPSWRDMSPLAGGAFREATRMASSDPLAARADLVANRENLLGWIDRYQIALAELRDLVAASDPADLESGPGKELGATLIGGRNARTGWLNPQAILTPEERQAKDTLRRDIQSGSFVRSLFGGFLGDRLPGRDPDRRDRK